MIAKQTIFTTHAAEVLGDALGDDMSEMVRQVALGYAELWRVGDDTYMITRVETYPDHTELCVVAYAGRGLREMAPLIVAHARHIGIDRIRFHSRESVFRMVRSLGFRVTHHVYELRLTEETQHG